MVRLLPQTPFDYQTAFSRNLGIVSQDGQDRLRNATVAIAGCGGVGSPYALTLTRTGIGNFKITDLDHYELVNFNRQFGATMSTVGRPKVDAVAEMMLDINPELGLERFEEGVNEDNIDAFLDGVDVLVDGIEFFEVATHRMLINRAMERGIPTIAACPLGFGAGMLVFTPGGMSFDDYFAIDFETMPKEHQVLLFAMGFGPAGFHAKYVDPDSIDLRAGRGPSFAGACVLCAGMVSAQVTTALLNPERLKPAPWYTHFDASVQRFRQGRLMMGNRSPWQRFKFAAARKVLAV